MIVHPEINQIPPTPFDIYIHVVGYEGVHGETGHCVWFREEVPPRNVLLILIFYIRNILDT